MIDTNTGKPVSESPENAQYNILPESVTGIKPNVVGQPVISPALQAKMDAKKNGTPTVIDNQNKELQDMQTRKADAFQKINESGIEM
jgi:hypothetical protein